MKLSILRNSAFCLVVISIGIIEPAFGVTYSLVRLGGFSPEGSKLSMKFCTAGRVCKFGYLDFKKKIFVELLPNDKDQEWSPGGFSPDGLSMAVAVRRKSEQGRFSQIGIVPLNKPRLTLLTSGEVYKTAPNFSHDGKKIIFAQANLIRTSGATRFADWDIYEISAIGRDERRLTTLSFFQISPPAYLPGDDKFIFSGDSPRTYKSATGEMGGSSYKREYKDNSIFTLPLNQAVQQLKPYLFNDDFSSAPSISGDGTKILYEARTDKDDAAKSQFIYDLFLFDGKTHRRMTWMGGQVSEAVLSPKGDQAAFVAENYEQPRKFKIYLLDIASGRVAKLDSLVKNLK
jgi:Tol biopolymer transport system component